MKATTPRICLVRQALQVRDNLVERGSDQLSPGDVAQAIAGLRSVVEYLASEHSAS